MDWLYQKYREKNLVIKETAKLIGIILFIIILLRVDFNIVNEILKSGDTFLMVFGLLGFVIGLFMMSIRYCLIMQYQNIIIPIFNAVNIYFLSTFWELITPARVGTLSRIGFLQEYNVNVTKSIYNIIIEKAIDLISIFIFLYLSFTVIILKIDHQNIKYVTGINLLFIVFLAFIFIKKKYIKNMLLKISVNNINFYELFENVFYEKNLILILLFTFGVRVIHFICIFLLTQAFSLNVPFLKVIFCVTSSNIIALIPISIFGIGTRDAWMIFVFKWFGYSSEMAILFSSFSLVVYVEVLIFCGIWQIFSKQKRIYKKEQIKSEHDVNTLLN